MATSEVGIVNLALAKLGAEAITALTDETPGARLALRHYATLRDTVLRERQWNCAVHRTTLTQLDTGPTFGYANSFLLPPDFIRFIRLEELITDFRIENDPTDGTRILVTDLNAVNMVYVFRLKDVGKMDELLKQAISARIAWDFSFKLTGDTGLRNQLGKEYQEILSEAAHVDAIEAPVENVVPSSWVEARVRGSQLGYRSTTRLV